MLIYIIAGCKYNEPDSKLCKGLFTLLPGCNKVLSGCKLNFCPPRQLSSTSMQWFTLSQQQRPWLAQLLRNWDQRSLPHWLQLACHYTREPRGHTVGVCEAAQPTWASGGCSSLNYWPDFCFPFPVNALVCAALSKPGLEQPKCKSELGLGLRKRVIKCQEEQDASGQGEGWMLQCAGRAAAWTKVKKGGLEHLTYNSHGASWQQFEAKQYRLQLQRQGWGKNFRFTGVLVFFPSFVSFVETRSLMEGGITTKTPVLCWTCKLVWKTLIY